MIISEGGNPRDNFLKGLSKKTSSIEGGGVNRGAVDIKCNGPVTYYYLLYRFLSFTCEDIGVAMVTNMISQLQELQEFQKVVFYVGISSVSVK